MKQTLKILGSLSLAIVFSIALSSCGKKESATESTTTTMTTTTTTTNAPAATNDVDTMISDYEKLMNEYVDVSKKFKGGDMSVSAKYTDLAKRTQEWSMKLQQISVKMTPQQAQRLSEISSKTATEIQK